MVSRVQQVPAYVDRMTKGEKTIGGAPAAGSGYAEDGTVDLHGNPVLKSKTGGWKACPFILGTIHTFPRFLDYSFLSLKTYEREREIYH